MEEQQRRARPTDELTPELIAKANRELLTLVEERLPERFYRTEPFWRIGLTALVARMAGIVDSLTVLVTTQRQSDSLVLLRVLYEHVITFCWLAIDPEPRVDRWAEHSTAQRLKLHRDAALFDITLMTDEELMNARDARRLPPLDQRADEVDEYWGPRIRGFRVNPSGGPKQILAMRGLYTALFRLASRPVHAEVESVDACMEVGQRTLVRSERDESLFWSGLAVPVFTHALLVCNKRLGWPGADEVSAINDTLVHSEDERRSEASRLE